MPQCPFGGKARGFQWRYRETSANQSENCHCGEWSLPESYRFAFWNITFKKSIVLDGNLSLKKVTYFPVFRVESSDFNLTLTFCLGSFWSTFVMVLLSQCPNFWDMCGHLFLFKVSSLCCAFGVPQSTFYQETCHFTFSDLMTELLLVCSGLRNQICKLVKILCKEKVNRSWVRNLAFSLPLGFIQSFLEGNSSSRSLGTVALNYMLL